MADTRNADNLAVITVSSTVLGELLGLGDRQIRNLAAEGVLIKNSHGKYKMMESVKNYVLMLKASKAGRFIQSNMDEDFDLSEEKAKHERLKAQITELQLLLIQGKVHKSEDVQMVMTDMLERFKSKLNAMPAKLGKKLEGKKRVEIQNILNVEIINALEELSEYSPEDFYSDDYLNIEDDYILQLDEDDDYAGG